LRAERRPRVHMVHFTDGPLRIRHPPHRPRGRSDACGLNFFHPRKPEEGRPASAPCAPAAPFWASTPTASAVFAGCTCGCTSQSACAPARAMCTRFYHSHWNLSRIAPHRFRAQSFQSRIAGQATNQYSPRELRFGTVGGTRAVELQNLTISRLTFHEVYRRLDDRRPQPPTYGDQLVSLTGAAMDALRDRIVSAAGTYSQSMDMTIARHDGNSSVAIAEALLTATNDRAFVQTSRRAADKLTEAQQSRGIPGGILAVFAGHAGNPIRPVIGYIKAELHSGFRRGTNLTVEYISTLFMTPQTKLYKIGLFAHDGRAGNALPEGWSASVYDSQMSPGNRDGAARYFFESFLGLELPQTGARMTRKFWESTSDYIRSAPVSDEDRGNLLTGLYSYLRVDQSASVEVAAFSNTYLTPTLRDQYRIYMQREGFPTTAIAKDLSELSGKLRQRRIKFSRDVQLIGPPEAFRDLVTIETIPSADHLAGADGAAERPTWTRITIRDRIRDQE